MKNLKKVVALLLVVAMMMSFGIVASASDFTDNGSIANKEAVDVMSEIGVISGFTDGSFQPTTTLTREQAAKILTYMLMGKDAADKLVTTIAPYSDVASDRWSAGAIAYCANEGIIAGVGNGKFDPTAQLTGLQFAKMLLVALGYDPAIQNLTGSSWAVNTAKLALDIALDDDVASNLSSALSRQSAAQMAFNTLKATMVEYDSTTNISLNGATISVGNTKAKDVAANKYDGNIDDDKYLQFAEKYFTDLKAQEGKTDKFGRPGTKWVNDGDTIGTYSDAADDTLTLNKSSQTNATIFTDSDFFDYDEKDFADTITVYVNGDEAVSGNYATVSKASTFKAGDYIEVFKNGDDEYETICVTRYSYAKIDSIDDDLSSTYTKKGASVSIDLKDVDGNGIGGTYYDAYDDHDDEVLGGFDAKTYTEDTVIAIALKESSDRVLASHVATVVENTVTASKTGSKASVTIGGTAYQLAGGVSAPDYNYKDDTYTVYVDSYGYVVGIDKSSTKDLKDVYYVTGILHTTSGNYNTHSYYAQAVKLEDGAVSEIKLEKDAATALVAKIDDTTKVLHTEIAGLYTFTDKDGSKSSDAKSDNGKFWIEEYTDKDAKDDDYYVYTGAIGDDMKKSDSSVKVGGKKVYLNSATQYIKVEDTGDDIDVTTVTGGTSIKATDVSAITVTTKSGTSYTAAYVVLISGDFKTAANSGDYVYVADVSSVKNGDGWEVELRFTDGTGTVETKTVDSDKAPAKGFYTYTVDDDGIYSLDAAEAADDIAAQIAKNGGEYDGETGYAIGATLSSINNNQLSVDSYKGATYTVSMPDVDFGANVIIKDERGKSTRDGDPYTNEITSVSKLKTAIEKNAVTEVIANVFYDDGAVILVSITEVN
ncbi:MAG: S-layer homology domain-containing protein [Oscillospiraceae bacterium]|nr:S-layer homology domain-containing protein [Oscillospiraceae bacterium]